MVIKACVIVLILLVIVHGAEFTADLLRLEVGVSDDVCGECGTNKTYLRTRYSAPFSNGLLSQA